MAVGGKKESSDDKLSISKKQSANLFFNLQMLTEKIENCIQNIDMTELEDVEFCNNIIDKMNSLIEVIEKNQSIKLMKLPFVSLLDDDGNSVSEYKKWVVGECFFVKEKEEYHKRRIVSARTGKEALTLYKRVEEGITVTSVVCFGLYDETKEYSKGIENTNIICVEK